MKYIYLVTLLIIAELANAQKHDQNWAMSSGVKGKNIYYNLFYLDFSESEVKIVISPSDSNEVTMQGGSSNTTYSDANGNLQFMCNGKRVFDTSLKMMMNGDSLNPSKAWGKANDDNGYGTFNGSIAIPDPNGQENLIYIFHYGLSYSKQLQLFGNPVYYSKIDMNANQGLGAVIEKNVVIDTGSFEPMSMVRHANGNDWWLMVPEFEQNVLRRYLITKDGVEGPWKQQIGPVNAGSKGLFFISNFSLDGTKYARGWSTSNISFFDFDRCTGLLSNPKIIKVASDDMNTVEFIGTIQYSPSGRFAYIISFFKIFQIDMNDTVLKLDTISTCIQCQCEPVDPNGLQSYGAGYTQIGPDGNIYIGAGGNQKCLSRIMSPDKKYPDPDLQVTEMDLPYYVYRSMPYYPNYRLGPNPDPCDSMVSTTIIKTKEYDIRLFPNPGYGPITVDITLPYYDTQHKAELKVFDLLGKEVYSHEFSAYSYLHTIRASTLSNGQYIACLIHSGKIVKSVKFAVMR